MLRYGSVVTSGTAGGRNGADCARLRAATPALTTTRIEKIPRQPHLMKFIFRSLSLRGRLEPYLYRNRIHRVIKSQREYTVSKRPIPLVHAGAANDNRFGPIRARHLNDAPRVVDSA